MSLCPTDVFMILKMTTSMGLKGFIKIYIWFSGGKLAIKKDNHRILGNKLSSPDTE